ncbi:MAG: magnesium transporter [Deltaproteobacteria bacterium]|nr:magnesium transporter [Deltaproteobacteria bacterium]
MAAPTPTPPSSPDAGGAGPAGAPGPTIPAGAEARARALHERVMSRAPSEARKILSKVSPADAAACLKLLNPTQALEILDAFDDPGRAAVLAATSPAKRAQWEMNARCRRDSVGRMMEPPIGVFPPDITVAAAIERLREMVKQALITYIYVIDAVGVLRGVVVMRDLMLAAPDARLEEIMIREPFFLKAWTNVADAMREVLSRHYPVYPVCDNDGRLVGLIRGFVLFEARAIEISAQPGRMVGIGQEERTTTPWQRSLRFRHPWLQLNLATAFMAAAVVGAFQGTIDRIVLLAAFLPVLAGQSGNTGCQAMAVTIRGMTLGELRQSSERRLVAKEALLGLMNGIFVGLTAGAGMYLYARFDGSPSALMLGLVVFLAMLASCVVSGVMGVLVPVTLKRLGADPATASSIFLTTATDVASMGIFLLLATYMVK